MKTNEFKKDKLCVKIFDTREEMGKTAAMEIATCLKKLLCEKDEVNMIFAAAPSQNEVLYHLCQAEGIDWTRVNAFHMDEYIGLAKDAPQGFGNFLREKIYRKIFRKKFRQSNEYDVIFDTEKSKKIARIFFYLIYILTLVLTFLFANLGVSFTANTINYSDKLLSITNKSYYYNEVENLVYEDNRYTLHFDDGKELELLRFADKESIENEILPILQNNEVEFINNGD